jgi:hypothetical protein
VIKPSTFAALQALRNHVAAIDADVRPDTAEWSRELLALAKAAHPLVVGERKPGCFAELERQIRVEMITRQERGLGLHIFNREWLRLLDNALALAPPPRDTHWPDGLDPTRQYSGLLLDFKVASARLWPGQPAKRTYTRCTDNAKRGLKTDFAFISLVKNEDGKIPEDAVRAVLEARGRTQSPAVSRR